MDIDAEVFGGEETTSATARRKTVLDLAKIVIAKVLAKYAEEMKDESLGGRSSSGSAGTGPGARRTKWFKTVEDELPNDWSLFYVLDHVPSDRARYRSQNVCFHKAAAAERR